MKNSKIIAKHYVSDLSTCELLTMKCLWDAKSSKPDGVITCQEIMELLKIKYGVEYKDTTVYTYLKNLLKKGYVSCYKRGVYFYSPLKDEKEYFNSELDKFKKIWFDDDASLMAEHIISTLSKEEKNKVLSK